jgi:hypothetical protein
MKRQGCGAWLASVGCTVGFFITVEADECHLKGQKREMVFWLIHSFHVWIERIWKIFEFGLLLTKVRRDFAHLAL